MKKTSHPLAVRNCNLQLPLLPAGSPPLTDSGNKSMTDESTNSPKQLTIFNMGCVLHVCDATELQVRAIIWSARRKMDERMNTNRRKMDERMNTNRSEPVSLLQSQLHSPIGLSMKRSLQWFLQKRKNRIRATSLYKK